MPILPLGQQVLDSVKTGHAKLTEQMFVAKPIYFPLFVVTGILKSRSTYVFRVVVVAVDVISIFYAIFIRCATFCQINLPHSFFFFCFS